MRHAKHFISFPNAFNELNKTGSGMLDSIYHIIFKLLKNCIFGLKISVCCHLLRNVLMDIITKGYYM